MDYGEVRNSNVTFSDEQETMDDNEETTASLNEINRQMRQRYGKFLEKFNLNFRFKKLNGGKTYLTLGFQISFL